MAQLKTRAASDLMAGLPGFIVSLQGRGSCKDEGQALCKDEGHSKDEGQAFERTRVRP